MKLTKHGLSPWVRGTQRLSEARFELMRFIPVGTGNSLPWPSISTIQTVYPRGYGELKSCSTLVANMTGLSPWVRGTLRQRAAECLQLRFIPVGTGNSARPSNSSLKLAVYPRGYGELLSLSITAVPSFGLSPWVRGTLRLVNGGLSPWVRGTHWPTLPAHGGRRFIPVGTGNSRHPDRASRPRPVYPRGYGELKYHLADNLAGCGLSPWVRGTRPPRRVRQGLRRFIPVGTGNSTTDRPNGAPAAVYPRGYGELGKQHVNGRDRFGLSPWVRGTLHWPALLADLRRFIPVGTGNSLNVHD